MLIDNVNVNRASNDQIGTKYVVVQMENEIVLVIQGYGKGTSNPSN